jgi:hypothetical protein
MNTAAALLLLKKKIETLDFFDKECFITFVETRCQHIFAEPYCLSTEMRKQKQ